MKCVMNTKARALSPHKVGNYGPSGDDDASVDFSVRLLLCKQEM